MDRKVEVVPYNPVWPQLFQEELKILLEVLQPEFLGAHHFGSTSIPGIMAKPILDLLIEVQSIDRVDALNPAMMAVGYEPRGEYGIPGRRYFSKDTHGIRTHHVHIYQSGHTEIQRHLNFRDFMRAHPDHAQAYSRLKVEIAAQFTYDPAAYTDAKTDFIQQMDALAAVWRAQNPLDEPL